MSENPVFEVLTAEFQRVYIRAERIEAAMLYAVSTLSLNVLSITKRDDIKVEVVN